MKWVDGSVYKGEWVNGVQHGRGEMVFSDGTYKKGLFENNVFIEEIIEEDEKEEESSILVDSQDPDFHKKLRQLRDEDEGEGEMESPD